MNANMVVRKIIIPVLYNVLAYQPALLCAPFFSPTLKVGQVSKCSRLTVDGNLQIGKKSECLAPSRTASQPI